MQILELDPVWTLNLNTNDLRLVLKALGGRLREDDTKDAFDLGERLTEARISVTRSRLKAIDKLEENFRKP